MRNTIAKFLTQLGRTAFVLVAIAIHWVLDEVVIILPTIAVDAISKRTFKWTGNEYRFKEFQAFWNKKPPEEDE